MTHYDVLGVAADADLSAIKEAYHAQVRRLHPDKTRRGADTVAFDAVQRAWQALRDASTRAAYDASLRERAMLAAPISVVADVDLDDMLFDAPSRAFRWPCRCGHVFVVTEAQLDAGLAEPLPCAGCTLQIRVLFDVVD